MFTAVYNPSGRVLNDLAAWVNQPLHVKQAFKGGDWQTREAACRLQACTRRNVDQRKSLRGGPGGRGRSTSVWFAATPEFLASTRAHLRYEAAETSDARV
jgi:hypothetical protein